MASYLRPRRGKKATAVSQNVVLRRGEIFFEVPDTGVGTGNGKIKMGDGTTAYSALPYFMEPTQIDVAASTIEFTEATETDNAVLLSAISSGAQLKTLIGNIKKLLRNLNTSVTQLNNDLGGFRFGISEDGTEYGYIITDSEGADTLIPFKSGSSGATGIASLSLSSNYKATKDGIYTAFANIVYPNNYGLPVWSTTGTIIKQTSGKAENHYGVITAIVELKVGDTIMAINPYPNSTYGGMVVFYP